MSYGSSEGILGRTDRPCNVVFQVSLQKSFHWVNHELVRDLGERREIALNFIQKNLRGFRGPIYKHPVPNMWHNEAQFLAEFRECEYWRFPIEHEHLHLGTRGYRSFIDVVESEVMKHLQRGIDRNDLIVLIHPDFFGEAFDMPKPPCTHLNGKFHGMTIAIECNIDAAVCIVEKDQFAQSNNPHRGTVSGRWMSERRVERMMLGAYQEDIQRFIDPSNKSYHFQSKNFFKYKKIGSDYTGRKFWVKDICSSFDTMKLYKQINDSNNKWKELEERLKILQSIPKEQMLKKHQTEYDLKVENICNSKWVGIDFGEPIIRRRSGTTLVNEALRYLGDNNAE